MISTLGRYKIVSEIGQGAMGVVYKAVDPIIDRTVAIKTINLNLSRQELEEYEVRFQQEIKAAGRLNHPNIVTIYDVGKTDQVAYMAMEFLEGNELKDIIAVGHTAARRPGGGHHLAGGRRAVVRAPAGHRAPRREALEHHGDEGRDREDHRLRHRAPAQFGGEDHDGPDPRVAHATCRPSR